MIDQHRNSLDIQMSCTESKLRFNVSLLLSESTITLLQGSNGLGKSTLIRLVKQNQSEYGLVDRANFIDQGELDILEDLALNDIILLMRKRLDRELSPYFQQLYENFKASDFAGQACYELSGGQKQMVKILIGVYFSAKMYFFDEPFQNLDNFNSNVLKDFLQTLLNDKKQVVVVEHNTNYIPDSVMICELTNQNGVITNAL